MKALITLLIVGSSSVALARPVTVDHRYDYRDDVTVRDHRDITIAPQPAPAPQQQQLVPSYGDQDRNDSMLWRSRFRPVMLAHSVTLMRQRNRDHRPLLIDVDSRMGFVKKLRLDRIEGRAFIDAIVITYSDGHRQTVDLNQTMSFRSPSLTIELDHGGMTGVAIYGLTERGRATFDVIGLRR